MSGCVAEGLVKIWIDVFLWAQWHLVDIMVNKSGAVWLLDILSPLGGHIGLVYTRTLHVYLQRFKPTLKKKVFMVLQQSIFGVTTLSMDWTLFDQSCKNQSINCPLNTSLGEEQ